MRSRVVAIPFLTIGMALLASATRADPIRITAGALVGDTVGAHLNATGEREFAIRAAGDKTARLRMTTDGGATKNQSPDEPRVVFRVLTDRGAILVTRTIGNDAVDLRGSKESNLVEGTVTVTMDLSPDQAKRVSAVQAHWATH